MPTMTIALDVPEGTEIKITGVEGGTIVAGPGGGRDPVEEYWNDYLTESGRKVYETAAKIEEVHGPGYSFEDMAHTISVDYESIKSYHRNSGRTAVRWRREKGEAEPPIRLVHTDYGPQVGASGDRSRYELPPGVADKIIALA